MRKILAIGALCVLGLTGSTCSTSQIGTATTDISTGIQAACKDVLATIPVAQAAAKGGAANTVSSIATYGVAACATAQAVAALVQNSSTLQWLGQLQGQLAATAGIAPAS